MSDKAETKVPIDPRVALLLLILTNVIAFTQKSIYIEATMLAALILLMVCCRCTLAAVKLTIVFGCLVLLQYFVFPNTVPVIATMFAMLSVYMRKIIPCLMVGTVIVKRIPMRYLILAMRKCRFPQRMIVSLSVTIRYFPAIRYEYRHIKDAMRLRDIRGLQKFESVVVPLIMSATRTAEELSAAAVTRGVENPVRKTSAIDIRFVRSDYIVLVMAIVLVTSAQLL